MTEQRTLRSLKVQGLFGRFDYTVPILRPESRIAILTAPNGYGKTHLLHMIDAVSRQDVLQLCRYTFDRLELQLSDQSALTLTRTVSEQNTGLCRLVCEEQDPTGEMIHRAVVSVHPHWGIRWENEEAEARVGEWPERRKSVPSGSESIPPPWLKVWRQKLHRICLLPSARLPGEVSSWSEAAAEEGSKLELVCQRIKESIRGTLQEYAKTVREHERSLPRILLQALAEEDGRVHTEQLEVLLAELRWQEQRLQDLQLISPGITEKLLPESAAEAQGRLLRCYYQDILSRFSTLEPCAKRLQLFLQTLNSWFYRKHFQTDSLGRLELRVLDRHGQARQSLALDKLSSGEQQLLYLLGLLVFDALPQQLILLDEPELSLHPAWQDDFLELLQQICELNDSYLLLATHSPSLVGEDWNLVCELADQVEF